MNTKYLDLKTRLAEIHDLEKIRWVLGWDQRTMMPPKGGAVRAEQLATLEKVRLEKWTSPEIGKLLDDLRPYQESLPYDSDEASLIRYARREYDKLLRVPPALEAEMARAASIGTEAWIEARKKSDFSIFLPHLQKNVELKFKYVECFDDYDHVYDVLLDDFEPGMKTAEVRAVFDDLRKDLVPLIAAINERVDSVSDACVHGHFPIDKQREFCQSVIERFGFNADSWRLDPTVHPFASSSCTTDIRITTRYYEDFLNPALFGSMHECGHGLYENGVSPALERTPLCRGTSLGLHESQSRMWENLVGRSRPFWKFFYPKLQAAFPDQFSNVDAETFYRAINKVQPSLIRVEADEATYNLHIILRFELEQEIMEGKIALRDLPEVWNARMKSYLGVDVPNDAQGVLQDIHWSSGSIGYFSTYSLGNIISCQIWEKALEAMPDLYEQFERGEFMALREWLRENLHRHGRKFTPKETLQKLVGGDISVGPYVRYLKSKLGEIYRV
ncbi:MAG TPA: carboxypeptidase M32 [Anaerolineales bacterium]|nr:carboxypeptidase M32 [Anaerolineales bacterium]